MHFDLITIPGKLIYTGDMGTFVFERLPDMFDFFRSDDLKINLSYWCQKLIASECNGRWASGAKEFCRQKFIRNIVQWIRESDATGRAEILSEVRRSVLPLLEEDDSGMAAMVAVHEFRHNGFVFTDFFDTDPTQYTTRFVWCSYALAWGIEQYDKAHPEPKP